LHFFININLSASPICIFTYLSLYLSTLSSTTAEYVLTRRQFRKFEQANVGADTLHSFLNN